jgi:tRNA A37 threonylcarbamoyladenosine modification protein TsaB
MADALAIPAYGICSLDALGSGERVAMTDARRREVYWARYDGADQRVDGPHVDKPADLVERLRGVPVVGDGAHRYADLLADLDVHDAPRYPSAVRIAQLARTAGPLTPLYLRRPDAVEPGAAKRVTA